MEAVNSFYEPWLNLMLWIGVPLFLVVTPALFLFERRSFMRWLAARIALWGVGLILLSLALRMIIRILEDALANLPGA